MVRTVGRLVTALTSASALVALGSVPASADVVMPPGTLTPPDSGSFLYMNSEPGDYIGGGREHLYTFQDAHIRASGNYDSGVSGAVDSIDGSHWWYLDFAAPDGQPLEVGSYTGAARFPFQETTQPGLSVSGDGRGCNTLTGQFDVAEIQYAPDGSPAVVDITFEQHCEGGDAALFGRFRYESDGPVPTDTTAPTITAYDSTAQADDENGAVVHYDVYASDDWDPSPTVTCDHESGSLFPVGDTLVTCTATDRAGNTSAPTSFTVHVLPPLEATLVVTSGSVNSQGVVTLAGTATCSREANGDVSGTLTQTVARRGVVTGSFASSTGCSPAGTTWQVTFTADTGRFAPGSATYDLAASFCDVGCDHVQRTGTVRLKGR